MSVLADALQPQVPRALFRPLGGMADVRISDALIAPGSAYDVGFIDSQRTFTTDFRDSIVVARIAAFDVHRLCTAALQTATDVEQRIDDKFALPWNLVQLYYASFYAAHGLVRILGGGCCWLESSHTDRVRNVGAAVGLNAGFKLEPGNYSCLLDASGTGWSWRRLASGRGTHESFWTYFDGHMRLIAHAILSGPLTKADSQAAFAKLTELLDLGVVRNSSPHWLSTIRNDVQYAFGREAWHPTGVRQAERANVKRWALAWRSDPAALDFTAAASAGDLCLFVAACAFNIGLCRTLVQRVAERSSTGRSGFVRYAPENFLSVRTP